MFTAKSIEPLSGDMSGPLGRCIALSQQVHVLVGAVSRPAQSWGSKGRRLQQRFKRAFVGH